VREAEPIRVACFESDGQVFQRASTIRMLKLAFYDLSCQAIPSTKSMRSHHSIQRTPMPFTGPLFNLPYSRQGQQSFTVRVRTPT